LIGCFASQLIGLLGQFIFFEENNDKGDGH